VQIPIVAWRRFLDLFVPAARLANDCRSSGRSGSNLRFDLPVDVRGVSLLSFQVSSSPAVQWLFDLLGQFLLPEGMRRSAAFGGIKIRGAHQLHVVAKRIKPFAGFPANWP
jgi:hypothetical protein